jgi:hypothetical protein
MSEPNEHEAQSPDTERSDNEAQDAARSELDTATEKRYRRKSVRRQLQDVVTRLGKVAEDPHQKPAKKVDALLRQSEVLLKLAEMDAEDKQSSVTEENAALTAQHATDTAQIAELEAQMADLRQVANRVTTVTVPDPEHEKTRQQCETLTAVIDFLLRHVEKKEQTAIRAVQELTPAQASRVCEGVGLHYNDYAQWLRNYSTFRQLNDVIEKARIDTSPLLRFCRAALAVNHQVAVAEPRRKAEPENYTSVTGEEKLRRAKLETGMLTRGAVDDCS